MGYKKNLITGVRVEAEHKDVMQKMRKYLDRNKKLPTNKVVFKWIAQTHLKEHKNYYTKLKQAKL